MRFSRVFFNTEPKSLIEAKASLLGGKAASDPGLCILYTLHEKSGNSKKKRVGNRIRLIILKLPDFL